MTIVIIAIACILLLIVVVLAYKIGRYKEASKIASDYAKDVDKYVQKLEDISRIRIDDYSKSDILSGKVLSEGSKTEDEPTQRR